jgi:hypothetical protein
MPYAILAGSIKWEFTWVFSTSLSLFPKLSMPDWRTVSYMYTMTMPYLHWLPVALASDCCNFLVESKRC